MRIFDLISASEAAAILHCDRATVQRHAARGTLPTLGKLGGCRGSFVFRRCEVEAAKEAGWPRVTIEPLFEVAS